MSFDNFGFSDLTKKSISDVGYLEPSDIQKKSIPLIMKGGDVIAQAQTGTGKTAAFALPIIDKIKKNGELQALVVAPTRELARQVENEFYKLSKYAKLTTMSVCGGHGYERQISKIKKGVEIIVATPGRLIDLLEKNVFRDFSPDFVVLDEADEMLNMGFLDDVLNIFDCLKGKKHQTMLFSATISESIKKLANNILNNPSFVSVVEKKENNINKNIEEYFSVVEDSEKDEALMRFLSNFDIKKSIIFCKTKSEVDRLNTVLLSNGHTVGSLHGDIEQRQRNKIIQDFQNDVLKILIATDVASRGLDVKNVTHVFNFHLPFESESYVHRIGRTGRAGEKGTAVTIINKREFYKLKNIKKETGGKIDYHEIPTLTDLKNSIIQSLSNELQDKKDHDYSEILLDKIIDTFGKDVAMKKMANYILANINHEGRHKIGFTEKDLLNIFSSRDRDNKRSFNRNRKGGNFRNNRNSGSNYNSRYKKNKSEYNDYGDSNRSGYGDKKYKKNKFHHEEKGDNKSFYRKKKKKIV